MSTAKMREISSGTLTVDSLKVAILAALHIADEYHQLINQQQQTDAAACVLIASNAPRMLRPAF